MNHSKICKRTKLPVVAMCSLHPNERTRLIRRTMNKARQEQIQRASSGVGGWQPATEALESAKKRRHSPTHQTILILTSSPQPCTSKSNIDMSSIFQEANAIDVDAFQFPDIEWSFGQDDLDVGEKATQDFSRTLNTNPGCALPDTTDDMSTTLNPESFSLKRMRRIGGTENPSRVGMVRSQALYSNLFLLDDGSFSSLSPSK